MKSSTNPSFNRGDYSAKPKVQHEDPICRQPMSQARCFQEGTIFAPSAKPTPSLPGGWQLHSVEARDPGRLRSHQKSTLSETSRNKATDPAHLGAKDCCSFMIAKDTKPLNASLSVSTSKIFSSRATSKSTFSHLKPPLRQKDSKRPVSESTTTHGHPLQSLSLIHI